MGVVVLVCFVLFRGGLRPVAQIPVASEPVVATGQAGRSSPQQSEPLRWLATKSAAATAGEAKIRQALENKVDLEYSGRPLDQSLEDVARQCGLTVRTILRRFGSRDGVLEAVFAQLARQIVRDRPVTPPGDIDAALAALLHQYERDGDLNIKALDQESELPLLHKMMERGRAGHRAWLRRIFGPYMTHLDSAARTQRTNELYAATDVYLWKLLRRDLKVGKQQTAEAFRHLVLGVTRLEREKGE